METGPGTERHSDDELATALEAEVARITTAIPVAPAAEEWAGPPSPAISFDDLPVRRRAEGPQPTFSAWVGAAAPPRAGRSLIP